ncbi:uncharacterized protein LOC5521691 isoform X2 [Nematostella vectensis]|nr:uncharacterized protein LOC5521691 isoform X2 [Nematostella vectensis]
MKQAAWIGLNDRAIEGTYVWEGDNTKLGQNYSHWYSGEPNDHASVEDCISMYSGSLGGFWNDDYCDTLRAYVCEKPNGQSLCPVNWVPYKDSCYHFNTHQAQLVTWEKAYNVCQAAMPGSDLLSILEKDEQQFIEQVLSDRKSGDIWLGLNDRVSEGTFVWSDRSPVNYTNWGQYEPSKYGSDSRDCVSLIPWTPFGSGDWGTVSCTTTNAYVCKKTRASSKCDAPFGLADYTIDDSLLTASSSDRTSVPAFARLRLQSKPGSSGAWCSAKNTLGEYLQVDLGLRRQVTHIAIQGRPKSTDFVKSFYLKYGNDGSTFNYYGANATENYLVLNGSSDSDTVANIMLKDPINARFVRIYPSSWSNNICLRIEIYGCASQAYSRKCGTGWEEGPDSTCYQFNTDSRKIWADARATCLGQGGDLLSIVTNNEKAYIETRVKALDSSAGNMWIGLNDRETSRLFSWSDQSPLAIIRWDAGFPNDPKNTRSCVELVPSRAAWRDVDCGQFRPFICKRKLGSNNTPKLSRTANWISTADYYWPLDNIIQGRALGTANAKVTGNVSHPEILQNGHDVLQFSPSGSYLSAGDVPGCVSDAETCNPGFTVSVIIKLDSSAASWTNRVFLVDTIGDERFASSRGFSVYLEGGRIKAEVFTVQRTWSFSTGMPRVGMWHHVMITWHKTAGLIYYLNGRESGVMAWARFVYPQHTTNNVALTIGSKPTQQATGPFYMRSLAIWTRVLDANDVTDIYNSEFGNCKTGWKEFGQFCYQFNMEKKSWSAARQQCQANGGDLVSIQSPVEQAHITLEVGQFGVREYAWIGLHDESVESAWEWSDGSPVRFTNWYNNQPDNWLAQEDCAHTYHEPHAVGRWNDMPCYSGNSYICKAKKAYVPFGGSVNPTTAPETKIICEFSSAILSCPASTTITIQSANFGRTSSAPCGMISVTNCVNNVTDRMKDLCEGKNFCSVRPVTGLFGNDPCPSVTKYLETTYTCTKGTVVTPGCPVGWKRSPDGNVCYGLILDKKTWPDARDSCRAQGAELASIHTGWESALVTSLLVTSWDAGDVWIGLTDTNQRGMYRWTDGSPVDWTHWWNGEPNDRGITGSCVRATMTVSSRDWMYWVDSDCTENSHAYVCKMFRRNYTPPPPSPTTAATGPCPFGWKVYRSACYRVFMSPSTWTGARDACRATGDNTDLVSMHDSGESLFVQSLTNNSLTLWIGLNDRGSISGHLWSDGTPVQFTRWGPAEPDSHSGQQPCVVLKSTGYWGDVGCYATRPYMCKRTRPSRATPSRTPTSTPSPTTQAPGVCDAGWVYWGGLCYYFSNATTADLKTWMEARDFCRKSRGDLVSLRTANENAFVFSEIKTRYYYWTVWIGLNDLGTEGVNTWSDGSPMSYINWGNKEPNNWNGMEDCGEMSRFDGRWNDQNCNLKRTFVCRKHNNTIFPPFTMIPPSPGPAVGKCDSGWINYDKSCYKFVFDQRQNWANAESVCSQGLNSTNSGHLVVINNLYEQAFLTTMLASNRGNVWIGLNDLHTEGTFGWVDYSSVAYTNWIAGKPGWSYWADCVGMSTSSSSLGEWDVEVCSGFQGYVCETDALPLGPTTTPPTPSPDCPSGYSKYGESCYLMYYNKLNWKEAGEVCQKDGAQLISIHGVKEQAYMIKNLKDLVGNVWTGMVRMPNSLMFTWSDQSVKQYTNWARGQPGQPGTSQTCVQVNNSITSNGRWSAVDCGLKNSFMCKIYKGEPHVTPSLLGECQPGWVKFDKFCYLFSGISAYVTWSQARSTCTRQGADLVSILNQEEQDFLIYQSKSSSRSIWIGLNDRNIEGGWQWSDGSPLAYVAWNGGEPNDLVGVENCGEMVAGNRLWNDYSCSQQRGYICKSKLECSFALGMSSGGITNTQLTSLLSQPGYGPSMARLNGSTAWCANVSQTPYIQVDFLNQTRVTKIAMKGLNLAGSASYVRSYTVQYGSYKDQWETYTVKGQTKVCAGNSDTSGVVTVNFDPPIDAQYLRVYPETWSNNPCAKIEFYGCPFECESPRGMSSGKMNDDQITASSSTSDARTPPQAKLAGNGWCPKTSDPKPWIQLTYKDEKRLTKVVTWGGGSSGGYVSKYRLAYSDDGVAWIDYTEKGVVRMFRGNGDTKSHLTHVLGEPIRTRYVRLLPVAGSSDGKCLRFDFYGCASACLEPQGLEQGTIEDSWIEASSELDGDHGAAMARLNAPYGWCAATSDKDQYLTINLNRPMRVRQIATQGSPDGTGYVKSFALVFKREDTKWKNIQDFDKTIKTFTANTDGSTVVTTTFPKAVRGQYFRLKPLTWSRNICIRVELYGCLPNNAPTVSPPTEKPSGNPTDGTVAPTEPPYVVYRAKIRLTATGWSDDYSKSSSAAFKTLSSQVTSSVRSLYSGSSDTDSLAFKEVAVNSFRRGSVIVDFNVTFITDLAEGANVTGKLRAAVRSGKVGELQVDPDYFYITKVVSSGGKSQRQKGDQSSGLSPGGKAAIAVVFVIALLIGGAVATWYYFKKYRGGKLQFKHQTFDNPIHFSSKAYDIDA